MSKDIRKENMIFQEVHMLLEQSKAKQYFNSPVLNEQQMQCSC